MLCKQFLSMQMSPITIQVSIAALEFNAVLHKTGYFSRAGIFFSSELLKIDFSESPIGTTPAMFTKSCIILLLWKGSKLKDNYFIQVAYFCILIDENRTETAVTYTVFYKKMYWCTFFNNPTVSTVLKSSIAFLQCAQVVLSWFFLSFSYVLSRTAMKVLWWWWGGPGRSGEVNPWAVFLYVVFKAYGRGSHPSLYSGNALRKAFCWCAVMCLRVWIRSMNHLTCVPCADTKFRSFCIDEFTFSIVIL